MIYCTNLKDVIRPVLEVGHRVRRGAAIASGYLGPVDLPFAAVELPDTILPFLDGLVAGVTPAKRDLFISVGWERFLGASGGPGSAVSLATGPSPGEFTVLTSKVYSVPLSRFAAV